METISLNKTARNRGFQMMVCVLGASIQALNLSEPALLAHGLCFGSVSLTNKGP
jgi:hypothetical protein